MSIPTQRSLKTLHIFQTVSPVGGGPIEAARQLISLYSQAGLQGFESIPFLQIEIASLDSPEKPYLDFPGCEVYPLTVRWFDRFLPISLFLWLKRNASSYDALIVHGIWGFHLLATWLVACKQQIPYVVYMHGMLDPWFKHRYPIRFLRKRMIWRWAIYPCLRDAHAVLFTCEEERRLARQSFSHYQCNEHILPYGTAGIPRPEHDYSTPFLLEHPALHQRKLLLFLGRVHPKKGPDLLFKAIAFLQHQGKWSANKHCLTMAGPLNGHYALFLKGLAESLSITDSIYWTGMLLGDQKWGAFQSADAFVLPSHQENYGIAVAESLSASTPVLVTHPVNISPDIATDGAGFVDDDTLQGVIRLLNSWLSMDPISLATMSANARTSYERRFAARTFGVNFYNLIKRLS